MLLPFSDNMPKIVGSFYSLSSFSYSIPLLNLYSHFPLPPMTLLLLTFSRCSTLSYPFTLAYAILKPPPTTHMMTPLTTNKPTRWVVVRSWKIGYG